MKTLCLVRHAKSDWSDPLLRDFDRPLNHRGEKDAPFMGKQLAHARVQPDLIVSSPALRAKTTAKLLAREIGYDPARIVYDDALYQADAETIRSRIASLHESDHTVIVVGHNPGMELFAEWLCPGRVERFPTCAILTVRIPGPWKVLEEHPAEYVAFDYPKKGR